MPRHGSCDDLMDSKVARDFGIWGGGGVVGLAMMGLHLIQWKGQDSMVKGTTLILF